MTQALHNLVNVILPAFVIIATGYAVERALVLDLKSLSRLVLYVLSPCLAFSSLFKSTLTDIELGRIALFAIAGTFVMAVLAWMVGRALRFDTRQQRALLLVVLFVNAGNLGLPVTKFAFGEAGLERAVVYFVVNVLLTNTVGVFIAARGEGGAREALRSALTMPVIYATILALALRAIGFDIPAAIFKPIDLMGQGAIPVLLIVLGMQLSQTGLAAEFGPVGVAAALRLVVAPVVALSLAGPLGLQGITRQVCVLEASMPSAVLTTVLATEFGAEPEFVTQVVFATTMLSIGSLTVLLGVLV
jgi:predicted permease